MARIHDTNAPTRGLRVPGISDQYRETGIDIPESDVVDEGGVAQVDQQTADALVEQCPSISYHEPEGGDGE
jgi:hypothetical protein